MIIKQIEIDDATADGFVFNNGYQELIDDKPNPEDKQAFIMRKFEEIVVLNAASYQANKAADVARDTAIKDTYKNAIVTYEGKPKPTVGVDIESVAEIIK